MKLIDTIIFYLAILFMLIGIHQSMMVGFAQSYWLFMLAIGTFFLYMSRKAKQVNPEDKSGKPVKKSGSGKKSNK